MFTWFVWIIIGSLQKIIFQYKSRIFWTLVSMTCRAWLKWSSWSDVQCNGMSRSHLVHSSCDTQPSHQEQPGIWVYDGVITHLLHGLMENMVTSAWPRSRCEDTWCDCRLTDWLVDISVVFVDLFGVLLFQIYAAGSPLMPRRLPSVSS